MQPKMIIFDKDGTIICFTSLYYSWMEEFIQSVETMTARDFRQIIHATFGFDEPNHRFVAGPGLLCEITMQQARENAFHALERVVGDAEANRVLNECWTDCDEELRPDQLKLTCDENLFWGLKRNDVKVVMCTNDTRPRALLALKHFNLLEAFNLIVAHGDEGFTPKPNPECVLRICEVMKVKPKDAVMIGDTRADTEMGKKAQLGCTIGVLTGVGMKQDLHHADIILETLDDLDKVYPNLLLQRT